MIWLTPSNQDLNLGPEGFVNLSSASQGQTDSGIITGHPSIPLQKLFQPVSLSTPKWELSDQILHRNRNFQHVQLGSQARCDGPIDFGLAEDYCDALDDLKEGTRVAFSKERLVEYLTGKTCSAMSLQFAYEYLNKKPYASTIELIQKLSEKYSRSSRMLRTIQAVFNTLHSDSRYPSADFMRDKVASMLRFYDRYISDSSQVFFTEPCSGEKNRDALKKIESFLSQFDEGVFVIRCIVPDDHDKGEVYGHTTLYIKSMGHHYFYDPNEGTFELTPNFEIIGLYQLIKRMMLKSAVPCGRIYEIQE